MNTKEYILNQFKLYPQLELQDLMKFLYQSSFGCEHLVSDFSTVKSSIERELQNHQDSSDSIEELDGDYIRLHLNYGLNVNTLSTLFIRSCQQEKNGIKQLEDKIQTLLDLIFDNTLPFSFEESKDLLLKWKKRGLSCNSSFRYVQSIVSSCISFDSQKICSIFRTIQIYRQQSPFYDFN